MATKFNENLGDFFQNVHCLRPWASSMLADHVQYNSHDYSKCRARLAAASIWFEIWGVVDLAQQNFDFSRQISEKFRFFQAISPKISIFKQIWKNIDFSRQISRNVGFLR